MTQLVVTRAGLVRGVYTEDIDLASLGALGISRAGHVEPDGGGRWHADMRPLIGPVLGPFAHRSGALAAEAAWLERHWLLPPG